MEGYFTIKVKFVLAVLLAALLYVSYLYFFRAQTPYPFQLESSCAVAEIAVETQKANLFFEQYFNNCLEQDPDWKSQLDHSSVVPEWTLMSEGAMEAKLAFFQQKWAYLDDSIPKYACLDKTALWSLQMLKEHLALKLEGQAYWNNTYPVNAINGIQLLIPNLLINHCFIHNKEDVQQYLAKIKAVPKRVEVVLEQLSIRADKGLVLPKFLFPEVLKSIEDIQKSASAKGDNNWIYKDFCQKIAHLKLPLEEEQALKKALQEALQGYFVPAYQKLYNTVIQLETKASNDLELIKAAYGAGFYAYKLKEQTSTTLTADEIYTLGLEEVARIEEAMLGLMDSLAIQGTLENFFQQMVTNKEFYYSNDAVGRAAYLEAVEQASIQIAAQISPLGETSIACPLKIKAVKGFRAPFVAKTFYEPASLDSCDLGTYYINTMDMNQLPKYKLEALTYAKAWPGRQFQVAFVQNVGKIPQFRLKIPIAPAYVKGWELYASYWAKEMGAYTSLYSEFGRLAIELQHACGLVVDIGIHHYNWDKEKAINYYKKHSPYLEKEYLKAVERHLLFPAQATTATIGFITILELRKKAARELGEQFDLQQFHEAILAEGPVPLGILQDLVDNYIQQKTSHQGI